MSTARVVAAGLFAVATLAAAVGLTLRRATDEGWIEVAQGAAWITAILLFLNLAAALWAARSARRMNRLASMLPGSILVESGRMGGLEQLLRHDGPIDFSMYLTVAFDDRGLTVYGGYSPPVELRNVSARQIRGLAVEQFTRDGRNGLRFRLDSSEGSIYVPVLGAGLIRLASPAQGSVVELANKVAELFGWQRVGPSEWATQATESP